MWKTLKTFMELIVELPIEDRVSAQVMPESHYLNGEQSFTDELIPKTPPESQKPSRVAVDNKSNSLIIGI